MGKLLCFENDVGSSNNIKKTREKRIERAELFQVLTSLTGEIRGIPNM